MSRHAGDQPEHSFGAEPDVVHEWDAVAAPEPNLRRSRGALLAACTVVSLGVGTGAFLIGRATAPTSLAAGSNEQLVSAATATTSAPTPPAPDTVAAAVATTALPAPSYGDVPAVTEAVAATVAYGNGEGVETVMGGGQPGGGIGQLNPGAYEEQRQELLAERTTAGGTILRAHIQRDIGIPTPPTGGDGWNPAAWCNPSGYLRITTVTPTAAAIGGGPWYAEPKDGLSVSSFAAGYVEGTPMFGLAVQVDPTSLNVSFATADGRSDSTVPTNGLALLVVDGAIASDFTVTVTNADGSELVATSAQMNIPWDRTDYQNACQPPTTLPAPGEQPADTATVEQSIRDIHAQMYEGLRDGSLGPTYIDDFTGIADAVARLDSGPYAGNAANVKRNITGFVFTSPTEAWFSYDIVTDSYTFPGRFARAHPNADGLWQFTRQSICQDLALAPGAECDPPVPTLYPPRP